MNRKAKIEQIMAVIRGADEFIDSIPVELWATDPAEVAKRINTMATRMGFEAHFTADDVNRFKE